MSLLDVLNPPQVEIKGARKVLNMTKRDDAADLRYAEEMSLAKYLKKKNREEQAIARRNDAIRAMKIRRLRDAVKRAKSKWEQLVKELEAAIND